HDPRVVLEALTDGDAFLDLVELLDDPVDLGGADAHAARVQHGIGAPVNDHPVARRELRVVAVAPDAGEALEIRRAKLAPVRVVPEAERHRRERRCADELALAAANRPASFVEYLDVHP